MSATFGLRPSHADDWRLDTSDAGLLIIDFQERLMPSLTDGESALKRATNAARAAIALGIPIFISEHVPAKLGRTVPELVDTVPPGPARQLLEKNTFSAGAALPPAGELPRNIIVAGVETHICVRQTVYDLNAAGTRIIVLGDACATRDPLHHALALEEFRADKIRVTSTEALFWECVPKAEGDLFRKMLSILK